MHLAQQVVIDTTHIADQPQSLIREAVGDMPQAPQQRRAVPRQGLLMTMAPGPRPVVLKDRLIGHGVVRVFDAPFVDLRIEGFLIERVIHVDVKLPIDLILPQGVGLAA